MVKIAVLANLVTYIFMHFTLQFVANDYFTQFGSVCTYRFPELNYLFWIRFSRYMLLLSRQAIPRFKYNVNIRFVQLYKCLTRTILEA